ncbi:MAG: type II secretion system protein [Acidobacteria bacterium]|nr:type II secretion system protein [Acidobacteriota bacterium]
MDGRTVSGDRAGNSSGYVLFGVLIGITLLGVGLTAAVTLWSQAVQREDEAELLFRGEAIVRALERFQQDRPGTLPETLDELVEGKYLRRAWLDPMTGRGFRSLRAAEAAAPATSAAGTVSARPRPTNPAGEEFEVRAGEQERPERDAARTVTGITGVVSTSDLLSFRTYEGARRYNEWRFEAEVGAAAGNSTGRSEGPGEERPGTRPIR